MSEQLRNEILDALYSAMRPIARFLLRAGISYREFNDIVKAAFVDVATEDYGIRGRPTNISRVAVMTGLTRKEVKRLRGLEGVKGAGRLSRPSAPADILHHWHTDALFTDSAGSPLELPYDDDICSFSALVKAYAGDIPPGAMRTELLRVGAIEEYSDGKLKVLKREFIPSDLNQKVLDGLRLGLKPLASTIAFNTDPALTSNARFQRTVFSQRIPVRQLDELQQRASEKLIRFSENLDDDLAAFEERAHGDRSPSEIYGSVGVGLFYFLDDADKDKD